MMIFQACILIIKLLKFNDKEKYEIEILKNIVIKNKNLFFSYYLCKICYYI